MNVAASLNFAPHHRRQRCHAGVPASCMMHYQRTVTLKPRRTSTTEHHRKPTNIPVQRLAQADKHVSKAGNCLVVAASAPAAQRSVHQNRNRLRRRRSSFAVRRPSFVVCSFVRLIVRSDIDDSVSLIQSQGSDLPPPTHLPSPVTPTEQPLMVHTRPSNSTRKTLWFIKHPYGNFMKGT